MVKILYYTHVISVTLFILLFLIKTIVLFVNSHERLATVSHSFRIPERIIGLFLLGTGIYLLTQLPFISGLILLKLVFVFAAIPISVIAFGRKIKGLVLFSLLLFIGAIGLTEASKKKIAVGNIRQTASLSGQEIFNSTCAQCHGVDGKLGIMGATDLSSVQLEQDRIVLAVKSGKGLMVGYRHTLTDEQIQAVSEYVTELKIGN
ncbi:MAG: hypothetical protein C0490_04180 [Marivirga sp.]|nr:hypothetical protein [Marivirga sp.]